MSVLTKGLAMDFVRQGRKEMAITSIWPATVSHTAFIHLIPPNTHPRPLNQPQQK